MNTHDSGHGNLGGRPALPDLHGRAIPDGTAPAQDERALDWRRYVGILNKNRVLISCIALISLFAGLAYTLLQTPTHFAD